MGELLRKGAGLLIDKFPVVGVILGILAILPVVAQTIILLTPSKKDDAKLEELKSKGWFKVLWDFFLAFAPLTKEDGKIKLNKK